jgi:monofunctional biosynthetic peptidoglycan transglycosylase
MADVKAKTAKPPRHRRTAKPAAPRPVRQAWWRRLALRGRIGAVLRWSLVVLLVVAFLPVPLLLAGRFVPAWFTPLMALRLAEGEGLSRQWTPLEEIPAPLRSMAVASEDQLFCSHVGFDWKALERQFDRMQAGETTRGASTISQQTAKNLFLWDGRSWLRKALEAFYTLQLELIWPKRRILEVYLNIAETGPGVYGAAAASRYWFDKDLDTISRGEMARIIAILPAPRSWKAQPATANLRARSRRIDTRAQRLGDLDACVR